MHLQANILPLLCLHALLSQVPLCESMREMVLSEQRKKLIIKKQRHAMKSKRQGIDVILNVFVNTNITKMLQNGQCTFPIRTLCIHNLHVNFLCNLHINVEAFIVVACVSGKISKVFERLTFHVIYKLSLFFYDIITILNIHHKLSHCVTSRYGT